MKVIHVYKTDCLQASRVLLQTKWLVGETIFLHRTSNEGRLDLDGGVVDSRKLSVGSLLRLAINLRGQGAKWVFHAQSSLVYLYLLKIFLCVDRRFADLVVYDMHDLNEKPGVRPSLRSARSWVRYLVLAAAEWGVAKMKSVCAITVSNGLARAFASRTGGRLPVVVRSAPLPSLGTDDLAARSRFERALLFFGTPQRVPFELVQGLASAGYELHLYGRGIDEELVEKNLPENLRGAVKLFGPYRPTSLDFIGQYRFVVLYKPGIVSDNFRYSLPNKFFQGLAYGTGFVVSENFEEIREVVESIPGLGIVVRSGEEGRLGDLLRDSNIGGAAYYRDVHSLAERLSLGACGAYRDVMGACEQ